MRSQRADYRSPRKGRCASVSSHNGNYVKFAQHCLRAFGPVLRHSLVPQCQAVTSRLFVTATASFRQCCALTVSCLSRGISGRPVTASHCSTSAVIFSSSVWHRLRLPARIARRCACLVSSRSALRQALRRGHITACCKRALMSGYAARTLARSCGHLSFLPGAGGICQGCATVGGYCWVVSLIIVCASQDQKLRLSCFLNGPVQC